MVFALCWGTSAGGSSVLPLEPQPRDDDAPHVSAKEAHAGARPSERQHQHREPPSPPAFGAVGSDAHAHAHALRGSVGAGRSRRSSVDASVGGGMGRTGSVTASPPGAVKGLFGMDWGWLAKAKLARSPSAETGRPTAAEPPLDKTSREARMHSSGVAEVLARRGFVVHLAKDIHKSVSTATTKPIAVLGLQPSTDGGSEVALASGGQGPRSGASARDDEMNARRGNKLFPLYVNGVAKTYFKIGHSRDYAAVLRRLLRRDPLLTFALQKVIRSLSLGENKPISHVTSDPTGASASLYGLRITPCVWADSNGNKVPALLMEHNVAYDPQDVMPRLLRDYAVLSHVPSILTLIDFNGHVLYQNAASIDYCGDLTSHNVDTGDGVLGVLFQHEPQMLHEMLQEVNEGNYWQQVVRVPALLKRCMLFDSEKGGGTANRRGRAVKSLTAAVSTRFLQDAMEPEFQLDSFTTETARNRRNITNVGSSTMRPSNYLQNQQSLQVLRSESGAEARPGGQKLVHGESGIVVGGPFMPVPRMGSVTGQLRLGSASMPNGMTLLQQQQQQLLGAAGAGAGSPNAASPGHVAFSLPHSITDKEGGSISQHAGPGVVQASFSTGYKVTSTGAQPANPPGRRFMTLMQSAQNQQQQQQQQQQQLQALQQQALQLQQQVQLPLQQQQQQQPSFTDSAVGGGPTTPPDSDRPGSSRAVPEDCWHDISAIPLLDPVLDKQVILLLQTNVTARVELENRLADLTDAQLGMLEQLFPRHVIEYMLSHKHGYNSRNLTHLANHHDDVIVLFSDVVGFTNMSKEVEPSEVMHFLNELYTIFDDLVDIHDLYKLDTVGDCYIVVAGLTMQDEDGFTCTVAGDHESRLQNAQVMMDFARAMLGDSKRVVMPHNNESVQIRIGIHIGSLASGLVGPKMPKFTLFGDTMNTASRMESTCKPGCIQVSAAFAELLPGESWQDTGGVEVKGKGLMQTYLYLPRPQDEAHLSFQDDDGDSIDDPLHVQDGRSMPVSATASAKDGSATGSRTAATTQGGSGRARPTTALVTRPYTSKQRPKATRIAGDGGSGSRPLTAASAAKSSLHRSISRRNMSFRHGRPPPDDCDTDSAGGSPMQPLFTILNAIRGSGTGDVDDDLPGPLPVAAGSSGKRISGVPFVDEDAEDLLAEVRQRMVRERLQQQRDAGGRRSSRTASQSGLVEACVYEGGVDETLLGPAGRRRSGGGGGGGAAAGSSSRTNCSRSQAHLSITALEKEAGYPSAGS